jgi:hypothetical protein
MKKHASMGARILTAVDFPYPIVPIVRHHHERWDGRGYPDGLVGTEIPLGARILSVVDCFDALTSDRPYRPRMTDEQAAEILRSRQSTFYDPVVVETFVGLIPELRRADAACVESADPRASVVAGLAQTTKPSVRNGELPALPPSVVPRDLIDGQIGRLGGADASLFEFNAEQDALIVAHATPRIRRAVADLLIPIGSGVSGWVAANRSTIRRAEPGLDVGELANAYGLKTCVAVPVFVRADLFGVLTVYFTDASLPDDAVEIVGLLAQEVGILIARAAVPVSSAHVRPAARLSIAVAS